MGLFARRHDEDILPSTAREGSPAPDDTLPARFEVVSVLACAEDDRASLTGLVWSTLPTVIGQIAVHLSRPSWPEPGRVLPALVDPREPGRFAVTWAVVAVVAGLERTITASEWNEPGRGWDPGPDATHERAVARWLAGHDLAGGDLAVEPSLRVRLAGYGWQG